MAVVERCAGGIDHRAGAGGVGEGQVAQGSVSRDGGHGKNVAPVIAVVDGVGQSVGVSGGLGQGQGQGRRDAIGHEGVTVHLNIAGLIFGNDGDWV